MAEKDSLLMLIDEWVTQGMNGDYGVKRVVPDS